MHLVLFIVRAVDDIGVMLCSVAANLELGLPSPVACRVKSTGTISKSDIFSDVIFHPTLNFPTIYFPTILVINLLNALIAL